MIDPVVIAHRTDYADEEATVLAYEFKAGRAANLATRDRDGLRSLADVITFNQRTADRELRWFGQERMERAQAKGSLQANAYTDALNRGTQLSGSDGIDAAPAEHHLDALIALTRSPAWQIDPVNGDNSGSGFGFAGPAAVSGFPHVTVPAGFVSRLPVGVSFVAGAWQHATFIALAHAFKRAHAARRPPQFLPTIALDERYHGA